MSTQTKNKFYIGKVCYVMVSKSPGWDSQRVFRPCEVNIQAVTIRQDKSAIYTVIPTLRAVKEFDNDNEKLCDVMYRNATEMYLTREECQAYCDELNKKQRGEN